MALKWYIVRMGDYCIIMWGIEHYVGRSSVGKVAGVSIAPWEELFWLPLASDDSGSDHKRNEEIHFVLVS